MLLSLGAHATCPLVNLYIILSNLLSVTLSCLFNAAATLMWLLVTSFYDANDGQMMHLVFALLSYTVVYMES